MWAVYNIRGGGTLVGLPRGVLLSVSLAACCENLTGVLRYAVSCQGQARELLEAQGETRSDFTSHSAISKSINHKTAALFACSSAIPSERGFSDGPWGIKNTYT